MVPLSTIMNGRRPRVQQPRPLERSDDVLLCTGQSYDQYCARFMCLFGKQSAPEMKCCGSIWPISFTFYLDDQDVHQLCISDYSCSLLVLQHYGAGCTSCITDGDSVEECMQTALVVIMDAARQAQTLRLSMKQCQQSHACNKHAENRFKK